jgi:hypothetical protein
VKPDVSRASHRPVSIVPLEQQQHVIEFVLRLYADKNRRVAVLLQNNRGDQRAFQAMSTILLQRATERITGLSVKFAIVGY